MNPIVITGCSYSSIHPYSKFLENDYNVINLANEGQSNDKILKDVYDYINKTKCTDTIFICQLTYLHRIGFYHNSIGEWVDYQPQCLYPKPKIKDGKVDFLFSNEIAGLNNSGNYDSNITSELNSFYKTYLKYIYHDEFNFNSLIYQVDLLSSFVNQSNNKILFIYWPEILNDIQKSLLKDRKFFNIDGEYSMLKWSVSENMIGEDSHLSEIGSFNFSLKLKQNYIRFLENYFFQKKFV